MNRKKAMNFALPVLIIIAVYLWLPSSSEKRDHHQKSPSNEDFNLSGFSEKLRGVAGVNDIYLNKKVSRYYRWERNPFYLRKVNGAPVVELILNGIFWDEENSSALINDLIVKVGDRVNSYKVEVIEKNRVVLVNGSKRIELIMEIEQ